MTLIFDREGWSPKALAQHRLRRHHLSQGLAFKEVRGGQGEGRRLLPVAKGFRMREVRRCDDGHQTSEIWRSRRWRCGCSRALDHLPTTAVEPADPLRSPIPQSS